MKFFEKIKNQQFLNPTSQTVQGVAPKNPVEQSADSAFLSWQVRQFEDKKRPTYWYVSFFSLVVILLAYGLFSENFMLGIIAVLIALLFYLFEKREPQTFTFSITPEGVRVNNKVYEFSSLESFWVFYQPQGRKEVSFKSSKQFMPNINIPIGDADPTEIRKNLLPFVPEVEQDETLIDSLQEIM